MRKEGERASATSGFQHVLQFYIQTALPTGVDVDNQLSWSSEVNSVISKVSQKIGILRRNIYHLSPSARRLFYLAVIQPDLEYAATATIPFVSISLRDRLCSVWWWAVRCVAGADWQAEVAPILKTHRLTSIEHRWALPFAVVVRRCVQKSPPLSLCAHDSVFLIEPGEAEILFKHSVLPLDKACSHSLTERHLFGAVCQQVN